MLPVIERLDPPLYLETPKGDALAYFMVWMSHDHDILWVCFIEETRQCWTFRNPEVRLCWNYTMGLGRRPTEKFPQRPKRHEDRVGIPDPDSRTDGNI